jgi:membrane protein required for colicin V production
MTMNWIDYLIIGLLAFSCIAGIMRGLLREVISLVSWVVALWVAWAYAANLGVYLGGALSAEPGRTWAARAILFVGVMLVGSAIGAIANQFVRLTLFSAVDRLFGFLFGALRGFVALGLLVILAHAVRLEGEGWYRHSTLMPYVEHSANILRALTGERKIAGLPTT